MTLPPEPGAGRALSFGAVAQAYDAARPGFPADAVTWIVGPGPRTVLDLGAGTGKLSAVAAGLGHDVVAVDPSEQMLGYARRLRGVDAMIGTAESIPLAQSSVDAVIVGQAFHWFDHDRALPEIARVLRPGGVLGLLWNDYDTVVPWVRRFDAAVSGDDGRRSTDGFNPMPILLHSDLFSVVERATFRHWHQADRFGLRQLAQSHSRIALLDEAKRAAVIDQIDALYASTARPPEPMRVPYVTSCFRTRATDLPTPHQ